MRCLLHWARRAPASPVFPRVGHPRLREILQTSVDFNRTVRLELRTTPPYSRGRLALELSNLSSSRYPPRIQANRAQRSSRCIRLADEFNLNRVLMEPRGWMVRRARAQEHPGCDHALTNIPARCLGASSKMRALQKPRDATSSFRHSNSRNSCRVRMRFLRTGRNDALRAVTLTQPHLGSPTEPVARSRKDADVVVWSAIHSS